jgi:hypothetical protein
MTALLLPLVDIHFLCAAVQCTLTLSPQGCDVACQWCSTSEQGIPAHLGGGHHEDGALRDGHHRAHRQPVPLHLRLQQVTRPLNNLTIVYGFDQSHSSEAGGGPASVARFVGSSRRGACMSFGIIVRCRQGR